jgi:hypothetical protein
MQQSLGACRNVIVTSLQQEVEVPVRHIIGTRCKPSSSRSRKRCLVSEQGSWLGQVVRGYLVNHAAPTNARAISSFVYYVTWRLVVAAKGAGEVGTNGANRRALATICLRPSSLSATTFHRPTPKVGSAWGSSAVPRHRWRRGAAYENPTHNEALRPHKETVDAISTRFQRAANRTIP